jgi:hypothetical protein
MNVEKNAGRVLGYQLARELTQAEVEAVSGGTGNQNPSFSGPAGREKQDDVTTDDF